jgi:hypothetical protein
MTDIPIQNVFYHIILSFVINWKLYDWFDAVSIFLFDNKINEKLKYFQAKYYYELFTELNFDKQ